MKCYIIKQKDTVLPSDLIWLNQKGGMFNMDTALSPYKLPRLTKRWLGHVARMDGSCLTKQVLLANLWREEAHMEMKYKDIC